MATEEEIEGLAAKLHNIWRQQKSGNLALLSYEELSEYWQGENKAAAVVVISATESSKTVEEAASKIHEEWLGRKGRTERSLSYNKLPESEKVLDRQQVLLFLEISDRFQLGPGGLILPKKNAKQQGQN